MSEERRPWSHGNEGATARSPVANEVRALEAILVAKGYVDPAAIEAYAEAYERRIGPRNGAHVVAHAWADTEYRTWLLADAVAAIASLGYGGLEGEHLTVVENGPGVHNLVVCTLGASYPWPLLGLPPTWYSSPAYRSRAVLDPKAVLADFGVALPAGTEIRVWDCTAQRRYLVLPQRPDGTKGWSEMALAQLVTRDAMIGTGLAIQPGGL
jgi:nitrile hydratase subunit alpha